MSDALEDHEGSVNIGGRTTTNPRFADNIDRLAGEEEKLTKLVERLDKASTAYGIEISAEKTNMMKKKQTKKTIPVASTQIIVNGQKLDTVTSLKYLGSVKANEGSKPEIL